MDRELPDKDETAEFEFRSGDIDHNIDILGEIMGQAPRPAQMRAREAAQRIEKVVVDLIRGNQDPAIGLGITLALHLLTKHMIDKAEGDDKPLIQLLS